MLFYNMYVLSKFNAWAEIFFQEKTEVEKMSTHNTVQVKEYFFQHANKVATVEEEDEASQPASYSVRAMIVKIQFQQQLIIIS